MANYFPYAKPQLNADDVAAVNKVLASQWLAKGPRSQQFESLIADYVGAQHAVVCSSGSAALHLAVKALAVQADDMILVTANSFVATASPVLLCGAKLAFIDIDPNSGLISPQTLQDAIDANQQHHIVGIIHTDFAGHCADLAAIYAIAQQHGLWLIEDAAHAFGSDYVDAEGKTLPVGHNAYNDMTIFSFNAIKNLCCGEGGAITTASADLACRLRLSTSHGMVKAPAEFHHINEAYTGEMLNPWYYEVQEIGYNYRLSDIHCALGISQLARSRIERGRQNRQDYIDHYHQMLADVPGVDWLRASEHCRPFWHLSVMLIDFDEIGISRAAVMMALHHQGVGTQVHYIPIYHHPCIKQVVGDYCLPGAEAYYQKCLSVPLYHHMSESDREFIIGGLRKTLHRRSSRAMG